MDKPLTSTLVYSHVDNTISLVVEMSDEELTDVVVGLFSRLSKTSMTTALEFMLFLRHQIPMMLPPVSSAIDKAPADGTEYVLSTFWPER